jgi:phage-related tail fiber protein
MADFYTLLTNAGIAYETACKAAGVPIKLAQISVGDGNGAIYNPDATAKALKREVWRGPLNALFQDEKNPSWLLAEVTIPAEVGGWYVREAGIWTDTGVLYAIVKYPESFKPVLATSGSGKEFYIRSIFETSNASLVTLLIDDTVVKATRAWVVDYLADELDKLDSKQSVRVASTTNIVLSGAQQIDGVAVVSGQRVLVTGQAVAKDNGIYGVGNGAWSRSTDANSSEKVTPGLSLIVEEGIANGGSLWQLVTKGLIELGTTSLAFEMLAGRTGIQAGTYNVLTVDQYGRAVRGANPETLAELGIKDAYTKDEVASMFGKLTDESKLPTVGGLMSGTATFDFTTMGGAFVDWGTRTPALQVNTPSNGAAYLIWRASCWNERHLGAMEAYSGGAKTTPPQIVTHVGATSNAMTITEGGHLSISGIFSGDASGLKNLPQATADVPGAVLQNTASLGPNGWWKCAQTGMIRQWGITLGASDTVTHRSFPIAFPNRCTSLVASRTSLFYSDVATGTNTLIVSNAQFSVISGPFNSPDDIYWEATGY